MRLLQLSQHDELSLTEFVGQEIPRYAILSHTWGRSETELTLQDVMNGTGRKKAGYKKVVACGKQAAQDSLQYFWCDTCCIDKTSSAELSEAINSMWHWYRASTICYAYLADVPASATTNSKLPKSKWFTRGWTLQELLAPSEVMFFDSTWGKIGTKKDLASEISKITTIEPKYLWPWGFNEICSASIAQKMSWASSRETTREEDIAYCLLGLFDINMPLLYGEGMKAFRRLQEEIMRRSDDHSILAWYYTHPSTYTGLLAYSPADFRGCEYVGTGAAYFDQKFSNLRKKIKSSHEPYSMTNIGLHIELPLVLVEEGLVGILNCRPEYTHQESFAIHLRRSVRRNCYERGHGPPRRISDTCLRYALRRWIYIRIESSWPGQVDYNFPLDTGFVLDLPPWHTRSSISQPDKSYDYGSTYRLATITSRNMHQYILVLYARDDDMGKERVPDAKILLMWNADDRNLARLLFGCETKAPSRADISESENPGSIGIQLFLKEETFGSIVTIVDRSEPTFKHETSTIRQILAMMSMHRLLHEDLHSRLRLAFVGIYGGFIVSELWSIARRPIAIPGWLQFSILHFFAMIFVEYGTIILRVLGDQFSDN